MSDEDPLGGRPRSRAVRTVGLLLVAAILAFLIWFVASNTKTRAGGGGVFGAAPGAVSPAPIG